MALAAAVFVVIVAGLLYGGTTRPCFSHLHRHRHWRWSRQHIQ